MTILRNTAETLGLRSWPTGSFTLEPRTLLQIAVVSVLATATGIVPAAVHLREAYVVTAVVALVLLAGMRWLGGPLVYVCALLIATVAANSNLVEPAGRNMPTYALAVPMLAAYAFAVLDRRPNLAVPPLSVIAAAAAYVGLAAVTFAVTTLQGTRPLYPLSLLGIMTLGLLLGLSVIPTIAWSPARRRVVLLTLAALGPLVILSSLLLYMTKPIPWAGNFLGSWVFTEVLIGGQATGLVFPRATGPFQQPFGAAAVLAVSMTALLGLRPMLQGRARAAAILCLIADAFALFMTWNRDGWLIVFVTGVLLAAFDLIRRRRLDLWSAGIGIGFFAVLVALTLNVVGASIRQDVAESVYGKAAAEKAFQNAVDPGTAIRGGSGLSGREYLWAASIDAIREKPLFGWGLGHNQAAIRPYLTSGGSHLKGFTSDSIWLVTAVERGLVGLAGLLLFCVVAGVALLRQVLLRPLSTLDRAAVISAAAFVGLLAGATFETFLLGGLTFPSIELALMVGLGLGAVRFGSEASIASEPSARAA